MLKVQCLFVQHLGGRSLNVFIESAILVNCLAFVIPVKYLLGVGPSPLWG